MININIDIPICRQFVFPYPSDAELPHCSRWKMAGLTVLTHSNTYLLTSVFHGMSLVLHSVKISE